MTTEPQRQVPGAQGVAAEMLELADEGGPQAGTGGEPSAEEMLARDALDRLQQLVPDLLARDTAAEGPADESWVRGVLAGIRLDARAGRRIPVDALDAGVPAYADLGITEGAVRGLVRACETRVPDALIGRCRLDGDVATPGAPIRVEVEVSIRYGAPLYSLASVLREEIGAVLARHTPLHIVGIDIAVRDVQLPGRPAGRAKEAS